MIVSFQVSISLGRPVPTIWQKQSVLSGDPNSATRRLFGPSLVAADPARAPSPLSMGIRKLSDSSSEASPPLNYGTSSARLTEPTQHSIITSHTLLNNYLRTTPKTTSDKNSLLSMRTTSYENNRPQTVDNANAAEVAPRDDGPHCVNASTAVALTNGIKSKLPPTPPTRHIHPVNASDKSVWIRLADQEQLQEQSETSTNRSRDQTATSGSPKKDLTTFGHVDDPKRSNETTAARSRYEKDILAGIHSTDGIVKPDKRDSTQPTRLAASERSRRQEPPFSCNRSDSSDDSSSSIESQLGVETARRTPASSTPATSRLH